MHLSGEGFAFFCAAFAVIGAALAMVHFVFAAFGGAGAADGFRESGPAGHPARGQGTDIGAIAVEHDAPGHHFDILLLKAGACAMFAFLRALFAGADTFLVFGMSHNFPSFHKLRLIG